MGGIVSAKVFTGSPPQDAHAVTHHQQTRTHVGEHRHPHGRIAENGEHQKDGFDSPALGKVYTLSVPTMCGPMPGALAGMPGMVRPPTDGFSASIFLTAEAGT